jgi:5-methylcytosine-specific restriction protein A
MAFSRPCLDCSRLAPPGRSRCPAHERAQDRARTEHRRTAPGDGAHRRLRRAVNAQGGAHCGSCHRWHPAAMVEVDHRRRLADGGTDTEENVWALCRACHRVKTSAEGRAGRKFGS